MKYQSILKTAAVVLAAGIGTAGSGAALAESTTPTPAVMTDVAPLPAQERGSVGAVILEDSPVLAQRSAYQVVVARRELTLGRGAQATLARAQLEAALAEIRDRLRLNEMGASGQEAK